MYASGRALARDARELAAESPVAAAPDARTRRLAPTRSPAPSSPAAALRRRPGRACRSARPWAAGSGAGWPTWPPSSTRRSSSSAAASRPRATCCSRPAREEFANTLTGRGFRPPARIAAAALGPDAGLVGSADLARRLTAGRQREPQSHRWAEAAHRAALRRARRRSGRMARCRPCACSVSTPAPIGRDLDGARARISAAEADLVCVHGAPSLLRWRSKCGAVARRAGLVVVGGGRIGGGNLLLSGLGVDFEGTHDLTFGGGRGPRRAGATLAALARRRLPVRAGRGAAAGARRRPGPPAAPSSTRP